MRHHWSGIERYSRYIAAGIAVIATALLLAFQMNWIRSSGDYRVSSWYLIDASSNYFLSTEFADEKTCRDHLRGNQSCNTGSDMVSLELAAQDLKIHALLHRKDPS